MWFPERAFVYLPYINQYNKSYGKSHRWNGLV